MSSKNSCHVCQSFMCAFWLIAGQVTQHDKWHAWSGDTCLKFAFFRMFVTCFLLCWGLVFFSHPTRSLISRFPSPLSQDTSVSDTSVSPGQVSTPQHLSVWYRSLLSTFSYIQAYFQVSACVYSPTHSLEARLWESEVTANSPLSKRERCSACILLRTLFENSALKYTWQLT